jgi:hypothetical protein
VTRHPKVGSCFCVSPYGPALTALLFRQPLRDYAGPLRRANLQPISANGPKQIDL